MYSFVFSTPFKNAAFDVRAETFSLPSAFFFRRTGSALASRFSILFSRRTDRSYAPSRASRFRSAVTIKWISFFT